MTKTPVTDAGYTSYELEIAIDASRETVWRAIIEETDAWWLPDFHMVGSDSRVEFDVRPGGKGLVEYRDGGAFLVWYTVQCYLPEQYKVYLVGHVAPDWGGPATNNLRLTLDESDRGCILKVADAHHGRISDRYVESLQKGWNRLLGDGLRAYVESSTRHN